MLVPLFFCFQTLCPKNWGSVFIYRKKAIFKPYWQWTLQTPYFLISVTMPRKLGSLYTNMGRGTKTLRSALFCSFQTPFKRTGADFQTLCFQTPFKPFITGRGRGDLLLFLSEYWELIPTDLVGIEFLLSR